MENALVRLLKSHPFYGHFLIGFRRRETADAAALGVTIANGTPVLCVNPARLADFSPEEQRALLEHLIKHVLHLHMARRKGRHLHDWDIACDLAINPGIEDLPPQAAFPGKLKLEEGLAAEEYYRLLTRRFDTGNLDGQGLGDASVDAGQGSGEGEDAPLPEAAAELSTIDDHEIWTEADSTPEALAEEMVRSLTRDAYRKSGGEVPGELRPLIEGLLAPSPIPWKQVLRQFVAAAGRVGRRSTWKREHRRFAHETPGIRKRQRLHLLIGVDVSDSTNQQDLRETFARELVQIARGRESRLTVLYAGSRIQRIDSFRGAPEVVEVFEGGGFTDLRPVFEYARTMQPRPAAIIYLTDGIGPAPETMEFPTLWVLTRDGEKPVDWGVELRL
ncbi:MAG: VWA-like domain-containing protein, partial [Trichloromonas sp.]|nr:VWA-like domain-containing protein [Trichloromonas sp.]